ncbi:XRCC4-like factor-domain-containing protein [Pyronema omphalodes]|nr:XRCC4-like factor-domain-containing protein [Pyronema omphalodes]
MSVASSPWRVLSLSTHSENLPPLLIKTIFTPSSYIVHLTDLHTLWTENLDRDAVISRSLLEGTVIDPTVDASQLLLLLCELELLLNTTEFTGKNALSIISSGDELRLKATAELPEPLPELQWQFVLSKQSSTEFLNVFTVDIVSMAHVQDMMISELTRMIRDKDAVIGKMRDALEEGRVKAEHVVGMYRRKALVPFNEESWRGKYKDEEEWAVGRLVKSLFTTRWAGTRPFTRTEGPGEWWKTLEEENGEGRTLSKISPRRAEKNSTSMNKKFDDSDETTDEDDGFEALETPPPPSMHNSTEAITAAKDYKPGDNSNEESSSDTSKCTLLVPAAKNVSNVSKEKQTQPTIKASSVLSGDLRGERSKLSASASILNPIKIIGGVGGLKRPTTPKHTTPDVTDDDETTDESDCEFNDEDNLVQKMPPRAVTQPLKSIGRIGWRSSNRTSENTTEKYKPQPILQNALQSPTKSVMGGPRKNIGRIGGKGTVSQAEVKEQPSQCQAPQEAEIDSTTLTGPKQPTPLPLSNIQSLQTPTFETASPKKESQLQKVEDGEDEDARADRKRRMLAEELEAKKKQPLKKRRKF